MTKAAILMDGGYFLRRLPTVRPDVDATDVDAVVRSIGQLIQGHLQQLKESILFPTTSSFCTEHSTMMLDLMNRRRKRL